MKRFFVFVMATVLMTPYVVLAAPLSGANSNIGIYYNSETALEDTTDANDSDVPGDVEGINSGANYSYFGYTGLKFNQVYLDVDTVSPIASGMDYDLNIEYYNGSTWTLLTTIAGNQNPFGTTGVKSFSLTPPADWAETIPDMSEGIASGYYIRIGDGSQGSALSQVSLTVIGGGSSVPEFSTYMSGLIITLGGMYIYYKVGTEKKLA